MKILEVQELSQAFGRQKIIDNLTFRIAKKEIIGLVGKSGAGKSVLIKTLIGFYPPTRGRILIDSAKKHPIGFSMQNNSLYRYLTVRQNLSYFGQLYNIPRKKRTEKVNSLLTSLHLEPWEHTLVKHLSGGTEKRVDVACALLTNPDILILDEPFLGLDPAFVDSLARNLKSLNKKGMTIMISSHRITELSTLCTRFILLRQKKLYRIQKSQLTDIYS